MDANTGFDLWNNAGYRHIKYVNHIKKFPLECQGLMKNYYQCVETYTGNWQDTTALKEQETICKEKIDYNSCLEENKSKIRHPNYRQFNVKELGGEE